MKPPSLNIFLLTEVQKVRDELSLKNKEMTLEMENLRRANEVSLDKNMRTNQEKQGKLHRSSSPQRILQMLTIFFGHICCLQALIFYYFSFDRSIKRSGGAFSEVQGDDFRDGKPEMCK
jgi:hypothetical protein